MNAPLKLDLSEINLKIYLQKATIKQAKEWRMQPTLTAKFQYCMDYLNLFCWDEHTHNNVDKLETYFEALLSVEPQREPTLIILKKAPDVMKRSIQ